MNIRTIHALAFLLLLALMGLVTPSAFAQTYQGRISGTVTDQSGAVVVAAKVVITNVETGVSRNLESNEAGDYMAPNLPPGLYKITVEAPNFKKVERSEIRLEVAKDIHLDIQLSPGDVRETVTVTEAVPLVETMNDTLGGTFTNKSINDLPLNGRDFQNLVVLRPGVQRSPGGGFLSISSNGNRPEDNNFIFDGTDNNDPYYGTTVINAEGVQGTPGTILPIDAIQEFNAQENPPAEYGWKPGAIVNLGLKSGTNDLHGTAYYFHRNNALDARNFFNTKPDPQRALRQHQFGASIGGPIIKNKTFFFGAYEGVRAFVSNSNLVQTPATVPLTGTNCAFTGTGDCDISIPNAIANLTAAGIPLNSLSANLIGTGAFRGNGPFPGLFPVNAGTNSNGPQFISSGFPNTNRMDAFIVKGDHHFSDRHSLSGRYFFGDSIQIEQDITVLRPEWRSTSQLRAQVLGVNWTWTPSNRWVNEAKFGYNRFWQAILTADANADPRTTYGIDNGVTAPINFGMPRIDISGNISFNQLGGNRGWPLETIPNATFQFVDNVSWTRGRHTIRFGGEFRHGQTHNIRNRSGKGRIRFFGGKLSAALQAAGCTPICYPAGVDSTALEDFLAGFPAKGDVFVGSSERFVSMNSFGAFIQDDFRVSPKLTLNFGLRYDLNSVIHERDNKLGNFDPTVGLQQVGVNIDSPYDGDHNNFAPRFGFAWDPWGKAKTVFRGGFGMMYEIPILVTFLGQNGINNAVTPGLNVIPTGARGSNLFGAGGTIVAAATTVFGGTPQLLWRAGTPIFSAVADCTAAPCDLLGVKRGLRTPYVMTWNFNIQQAIGKSTSLQVGYVENRGVKLYSVRNINQVDPNSSAEAPPPVGCGHCEQNGRPFNTAFPFLGYINFLENNYTSDYYGLQTTLTQRNWHGMSFVAGYTWSHAFDFASLIRATQPNNNLRPDLERADSDLDIRHRFTFSMSYDLPSVKFFGQLLEGWQINNIVVLQTGLPWSPVDLNSDPSLSGEFNDRYDLIPGANPKSIPNWSVSGPIPIGTILTPAPCPGRCFGNSKRNLLSGPPFKNWDFSLVKNWKFSERLNMQLRAEFFNILNHPNFANPQFSATYGTFNDLSSTGSIGFVQATADVGGANPVIGTGGPRNIQFGLKFRF